MEQSILKLLKENREKGAVLLMETYAGLIWSACKKRLQNEEDIKDCVNAVFAEFCLNPERYDESKGSLKNYLCEIADRRAIDIYRKNQKNKKVEEAAFEQKKLEQEERAARQEEVELLAEALEKLEPIDSKILRMKYYDGMTYEEIARTLGMPHESVKKRGLRGRKKLLYIILVGLIIALLAACAAVVMRKYQFSTWKGFIWSEEAALELVGEEFTFDMEDWTLSVTDAFYSEGILDIECFVNWKDETKNKDVSYDKELIRKANEVLDNKLQITMEDGTILTKADEMSVNGYYDDNAGLGVMLHYFYTLPKREEKIISCVMRIEDLEQEFEFKMKKLPLIEIEESMSGITLSDGSKILVGQGYLGDKDTAIVNMYQKNANEYVITELVTNTFMGEHKKEDARLYLTDEAGNKYELIYGMGEDINQMGIRREYNLHFIGAGEGEYTLHIPRICVQKEQTTGKVSISVPVESDYMECNQEILFPDGTGFCITGIRRKQVKNEAVDIDAEGRIIPNEEEYFYNYYLDYEPIQTDEMEYLVAKFLLNQPHMSGGIEFETGDYCIQLPVDETRQEITVEFVDPYYMINESYEVNIEIEALVE